MVDSKHRADGAFADRRGFVMPVVIFALLIMSAVAVAALATSGDEQRSSRALRESVSAFYSAEAGLNKVYGEWRNHRAAIDALEPGGTLDFGRQRLTELTSYAALIRRVDNDTTGEQRVFEIESEGWFRDRRAVSRLAQTLIVSRFLAFEPRGALNLIAGVKKNGSAGMVSGVDECSDDVVAGAYGPDGLITQEGEPVGADTKWLRGNPKVRWGGTPDDVAEALGIDWAAVLAAEPDIRVTASDEWPPAGAFDSWPVIVAEQGAIVGSGRGLLIAPEDLIVGGGWRWEGLVLVGRMFRSNGTMDLEGALVTGLNHLLGDPDVPSDLGEGVKKMSYSSCSVARARGSLTSRTRSGGWRYLQ